MPTPHVHDQTDDNDSFVDELKPGTKLLHGQYTIDSFLNAGGFGITYLARDSLDRKVVIKECFPGAFCRRSRYIVQARSRAHQNELKSIVRLFVQEARSLAKLDHPNIVGVHQVFEDNETAYMALDYVEGRDLLDMIEDPQRALTPDQVAAILREVLGAVGFIHGQGMLHRDISPDNILIDQDNRPVLIDFGAAREQASKQSRVLSALRVVKDGYSPQEFYIAGSDQSPSSDLYALAASFYHLIAGDLPPNSQSRLAAIASGDPDPYVALAGRITSYDDLFLAALDKALSVLPKNRLQSAQAWLDMVDGAQGTDSAMKAGSASAEMATPRTRSAKLPLMIGVAVVAVAAIAAVMLFNRGQAPAAAAVDTPPSAAPLADDIPQTTIAEPPPSEPAPIESAETTPIAPEPLDDAAPVLPTLADTRPADDTATPDVALPQTPSAIDTAGSGPDVDVTALGQGNVVPGSDLQTATALRLPFQAAGERSNIIASATQDAPDWVQPGLVITDVNGMPVAAIADIPATLLSDPDLVLGDADLVVTFGLRHPETDARVEQDANLAIVQSLTLPTGHVFETSHVDDNWRTIVSAAPVGAAGALQTGDVVMTYIPTATAISDRDSLATVLDSEIARGTENFIFAVQRDGSMWVASMIIGTTEN